jgi:hypothetical protein
MAEHRRANGVSANWQGAFVVRRKVSRPHACRSARHVATCLRAGGGAEPYLRAERPLRASAITLRATAQGKITCRAVLDSRVILPVQALSTALGIVDARGHAGAVAEAGLAAAALRACPVAACLTCRARAGPVAAVAGPAGDSRARLGNQLRGASRLPALPPAVLPLPPLAVLVTLLPAPAPARALSIIRREDAEQPPEYGQGCQQGQHLPPGACRR